jgi:hypothetical protein
MNTSLNHALEKEVKHARKVKLEELRENGAKLAAAEVRIEILRERKWRLVKEMKELGHDFTATPEGMDVVLSSSPSFNWS